MGSAPERRAMLAHYGADVRLFRGKRRLLGCLAAAEGTGQQGRLLPRPILQSVNADEHCRMAPA